MQIQTRLGEHHFCNEKGFQNENMYTTPAPFRRDPIEELGMSEGKVEEHLDAGSTGWLSSSSSSPVGVHRPDNVSYANLAFDTAAP